MQLIKDCLSFVTESVKGKLLVFSLLISIVPALLVGGGAVYYTSGYLRNLSFSKFESDADQLQRQINGILQNKYVQLQTWARMNSISQALDMRYGWNNVSQLLASLTELNEGYSASILLNKDGVARSASREALVGADFSDAAWLRELNSSQQDFLVTDCRQFAFLKDVSANRKGVIFAKRIEQADGTLLGYLVNVLDWTYVERQFRELRAKYSSTGFESGYGYMLQASGNGSYQLVVHPDAAGEMLQDVVTSSAYRKITSTIEAVTSGGIGKVDYTFEGDPKTVAAIKAGGELEGQGPDWYIFAGANHADIYSVVSVIQWTVSLFILALIVVITGIIYYVSSKVSAQLIKITDGMQNIARGRLDCEKLEVSGNDELGQLASSYNRMLENLVELTAEIVDAVNDARSVADEVNSAAGDLTHSSSELSEAAAQQSSRLDETSASVSEISAMIQKSSENAEECNEISQKARKIAENSKSDILQLTEIMDQLNSDSKEVAEALDVIDDIAFQTNLLAVNAAVEAANAGEHGSGFAVVADEVRQLARRSADAADEISDIIEENVKRTEAGAEQAEDAREAISEIMESIRSVADKIQDVSAATEDQAEGIEEINVAMSEMEAVTEKNSSSASQTASASDELASQADLLQEAVESLEDALSSFEF